MIKIFMCQIDKDESFTALSKERRMYVAYRFACNIDILIQVLYLQPNNMWRMFLSVDE